MHLNTTSWRISNENRVCVGAKYLVLTCHIDVTSQALKFVLEPISVLGLNNKFNIFVKCDTVNYNFCWLKCVFLWINSYMMLLVSQALCMVKWG